LSVFDDPKEKKQNNYYYYNYYNYYFYYWVTKNRIESGEIENKMIVNE